MSAGRQAARLPPLVLQHQVKRRPPLSSLSLPLFSNAGCCWKPKEKHIRQGWRQRWFGSYTSHVSIPQALCEQDNVGTAQLDSRRSHGQASTALITHRPQTSCCHMKTQQHTLAQCWSAAQLWALIREKLWYCSFYSRDQQASAEG